MDIPSLKAFLTLCTQTVPGLIFLIILLAFLSIWSRRAAKLTVVVAVGLLALSSPTIKNILVGAVEQEYSQMVSPPAGVTHILLLSAGHKSDPDTPAISQLNPSTLTRLVEAVRMWRQAPEATLLVTGDRGFNQSGASQAEVLRESAIWLGVDPKKIQTLEKSRNTEQETLNASRIVEEGKLLVVSSAIHLPRAMSYLDSYGVDAEAAPTHFMVNSASPWWYFGAQYLLHVDRALHEIVGAVWQRLGGQ